MKRNGGYADFMMLYKKAIMIDGVVWNTKTPDASIRRIVQNKKHFFKIKPGLWALNDYKSILPNDVLDLMSDDKTTKLKKSEHSYYQGLITQLGNNLGYQTYIPNQCKPFMGVKLQDVRSK